MYLIQIGAEQVGSGQHPIAISKIRFLSCGREAESYGETCGMDFCRGRWKNCNTCRSPTETEKQGISPNGKIYTCCTVV